MCPAGYYCPEGTADPIPCGNTSLYCPTGSATPSSIPSGYYGAGSSDVKLFSRIIKCPKGYFCREGGRHPCLAGYYGDVEGLSAESCVGQCPAGWFCPTGTAEPFSHPCTLSPNIYCPVGSSRQLNVDEGYYSMDSRYEEGGGFGSQALCPSGSFCQSGVRKLCPGGRYGATKQMTNESCTGVCKAGWYCPEGSISDTQRPCGRSDVYCPQGSAYPTSVAIGHFTIGEEEEYGQPDGDNFQALNKLAEEQCGPGYYCAADGNFCKYSL